MLTTYEKLNDILPELVEVLNANDQLEDFSNLVQLLMSKDISFNNIAWRLVLELGRWNKTKKSEVTVSYSDETMKFWKVGNALFHGKFLRFMSGDKDNGEGNFAVPSVEIIRDFSAGWQLPKEIPPGIIKSAITILPKEKEYVLSVDGKKVAGGLKEDWGDQDLFGHEEDGETLSDRKEWYRQHREEINRALDMTMSIPSLGNIPSPVPLLPQLQKVVTILSRRTRDLRILQKKQRGALKKFQTEAGDDWRSSKYFFCNLLGPGIPF